MKAFTDSQIIELARYQIHIESQSIALLSKQINLSFVKIARSLLSCQGHILVSGSGTSRSIAIRLAHLLSCCGTPSLFIDPIDGQHGLSGALTNRDLLLIFSKGGKTKEIINLAKVAIRRSTQIITLTENSNSILGKMSDFVLETKGAANADPFGMIATGSSLTNAAMGDALCAVLLKMRGYTLDEFADTHPSGAVGDKLKRRQKK